MSINKSDPKRKTQVELAKELGFLDQKSFDDILSELKVISKQLFGLAKTVRSQ